jgi:tetratricopeptide (TPR) repeat protein
LDKNEFFISYNKVNRQIAEWIAWILEDAGYSTVIQAWDFRAGSNFVIEMQNASVRCNRTIAVLSQAYMDALFTQPEWAAAFSKDPTGADKKLIPVRVEDFKVPGMFGNIVYIDLVGLEEEDAKKKLLDEIECIVNNGRHMPSEKPKFAFIPSKNAQHNQKPAFSPIPVTFARLRLGSTDELVGRRDALDWLDNKLLKNNGCTCALASLHGMGGMGKTFLSQVFAEKNKDKTTFLPVYLGKITPFDAGTQLLQRQGIDTAVIDTDEKLSIVLQGFYRSGRGILILDDVGTADIQMLLPQSDGWSVLITTRDKELARKLCGDTNVKELDVLSNNDAIQLIRNVLGNNFREAQLADYEKLCEHLAFRPYSIRLAAGYLLNALDPCPLKLLERLKSGRSAAVDDDLDFEKIRVLLEDCLDQLEQKSALAVRLISALSVGADQGMSLERFVQWQHNANGYYENDIENALLTARDAGIVLVEKENGDGKELVKLRLHADLLQLLRKKEQPETVDSLITYLDELLVQRKYQQTLDRSMHLQVFSLVERFRKNTYLLRRLYDTFWIHLTRTGELKQAFELGELFILQVDNTDEKYDLQRSYGNQATILQDWGRLDGAMALYKKQELICIELGNKNSLQTSYGNQAVLLHVWGRLDEAMVLHKKKELICIELGNKDSLGVNYGNQALILQDWGRLDEAMELHKKQESICIELGNKDGLQASYGNQAVILRNWGRLDEAMELHKKEEKICIELGIKDSLQRSYSNQALILKDWGKLDEAMELNKKQETICIELGNKYGLRISYGSQALILKDIGKLDEAMVLHKKEETICIELGDRDGLQISYGNQAVILQAWGRLVDALELHKKEETICIELGSKDGLQTSYGNQAVILQSWGRLNEAMKLHKKKETICIEVGLKPSLKISYQNQINLLKQMKQPAEAEVVRKKLAALVREMEGESVLENTIIP